VSSSDLAKLPQKLSALISASPRAFSGWYVPVFKTLPDETPYHYGTAFGLEVGSKRFLVTAAHVLAKDPNNASDEAGVGLVFCHGKLVNLSPFLQRLVRLAGEASTIDLVVLEPKNIDLGCVFCGFFKLVDLFPIALRPNHYLAACGFPESKNRRASWAETLAQRPYAYFGLASEDSKRVALGLNESHFCMDFDLRWNFRNGFGGFKAPSPHGISGGPVLVVYDFGNPLTPYEPRLIGVGIETKPKSKCFVCVDVRPLVMQLVDEAATALDEC
jgi:hypothetical protein